MTSQAEHDDVTLLLPWYVNGTLAGDERQRCERHLATCAPCRELLGQARAQARLVADRPLERYLEHVHPRLLVEYASSPAGLEPETVAWIERKLETCPSCREALERLREVDRSLHGAEQPEPASEPLRRQPPGPSWLGRLWGGLAATLLRPSAALAYLLLLAILVPVTLREWGDPGEAAAVLRVLGARSDRAVRSETAEARVPPLVLPDAGDGELLLLLETDLVPADLEDRALSFRVELSSAGSVIWSESRVGTDFVVRDRRAVLPILLRPRQLPDECEITVLAVRPGDPLDGQALFRRSLARRKD